MDILLHLRRTVAVYPEALALIDGPTRLNWSQFDERSRRMASSLSHLGLNNGDRVAVLMHNGFRYFEAFYFLARMGAVLVPLNTRFAPAELAYVLNDCQVAALIVEESFSQVVEKILPGLKTAPKVIYSGTGDTPTHKYDYESLIAGSPDWDLWEDIEPAEDDVVVLMYTGGLPGNQRV